MSVNTAPRRRQLEADLNRDLAFASFEIQADALASGELSAVELLDYSLARIARWDPKLEAYVTVFAKAARQAAVAADVARQAGRSLGPFHGVPIALKDLFDYAGQQTGAGSLVQRDNAPQVSASVVRRLEAAGMIVIGKTHSVEFGFGGWGTNPSVGTPKNPWDLQIQRVPGGSSSGSAVAVAAGLASAALGSDTGGSVRTPAAFCGVVGYKTTAGLVSRHGLQALSPSLDSVGFLTRSVRDAAIMLALSSGYDSEDPLTLYAPKIDPLAGIEKDIRGFRLGFLEEGDLCELDVDARRLYREGLEGLSALGVQLEPFSLPRALRDYTRMGGEIMSVESFAALEEFVAPKSSAVSEPVRRRILAGRRISGADYIRLLDCRRLAQQKAYEAMDRLDAFVAPTCPGAAIPIQEVNETATVTPFVRFVNFLNFAGLSIPIGLLNDKLPFAMQIIVRPYEDPLALRIARALEKARSGLFQPPPKL